jgi:ABC-type transporter Mla subunit MlaD
VAKNLGSKQTGLVRFFRAADDLVREVAPVAETQAHMFVALDTTFAAFASVARPFIQETISETPPTLDTLIRTSPKIETFLGHSAALFADLRPGVHALRVNSPAIASALETGARVLPHTPELNAQLPPTARSLERFATDKGVQGGINRLTQLADFLTPTARFVGPAQSVCNYGTLLFRNAESVFSIGDGVGTSQRFVVLSSPGGPNNETSPSSAPANQAGNEANPLNGDPNANFLHSNPYPNTASPGQTFECEAGNEPYIQNRAVIGNVPGNQGIVTEDQLPRQKNARPTG